jgi:Ni,Fe-hydrogenase III small subunit
MTARRALEEGNGKVGGLPTRIWRLQYGPCWCNAAANDSVAYDYVRMRRTAADFGSFDKNILIVSERVIDGTEGVYRQVHDSVPDPKLVISAGACPTSHRFWDDLPYGWVPVDQVIPIDIAVTQCVTGNPEALTAALVAHLFRQRPPATPESPITETRTLTLTSNAEPSDA